MKRTKLLPLLLSALLLLSASGCRPAEAPSQSGGAISSVSSSTSSSGIPAPNDEVLPIDLAVLSGPTGVGAAYLMEYYAPEHVPADSPISVSSVVVTENSEATALLSNGEAVIAAVATNVASNFYHKTDGSIQMLAVNTMGVLYILEKGDSIQSMADLRGKTIYATGQGANPEYILNYLLTQNGLDPAAGCDHPVAHRPGGHCQHAFRRGRRVHAARPRRHCPADEGPRRAPSPGPER